MSKKQQPKNDDWFEPTVILGVGQYHSNSQPATGKSKHKHPIGFIRSEIKTPKGRKRP